MRDDIFTAPLDTAPDELGEFEAIGYAELGDGKEVQIAGTGGETARTVAMDVPPGAGHALLIASGRDLVRRLDTEKAFDLIDQELDRQNAKFREQDRDLHANGKRDSYRLLADLYRKANDTQVIADLSAGWDGVLLEKVYEALAGEDGSDELGAELIQIAAVTVRIWLAQRRKKLTDDDAIAVLRQLIGAQAVADG